MTDKLLVTQLTAEVAHELSAPELRVTQLTAEVAHGISAPELRATQLVVEVAWKYYPPPGGAVGEVASTPPATGTAAAPGATPPGAAPGTPGAAVGAPSAPGAIPPVAPGTPPTLPARPVSRPPGQRGRGAGRAGAAPSPSPSPSVGITSTVSVSPLGVGAGAGIRTVAGQATMKFSTQFKARDHTNVLPTPGITFSVDRFSWSVYGGCRRAVIQASGAPEQLWQLSTMLRCPVKIYDKTGLACWWGYVNEFEIRAGGMKRGAALDSMYNSVAVTYTLLAATESGPGAPQTTSYTTDASSIAEYGTRQLLKSADNTLATAAEAERDRILAAFKTPIVKRDSLSGGQPGATLWCHGWFDTLDWQYYSNANTTSVATTTQISAIVTASGPFLVATDIDTASGISTNEYRDSQTRALSEVLVLMDRGTTNYRRILAQVSEYRRLRLYEEGVQAKITDWTLDAGGLIRDEYGVIRQIYLDPTGHWIKEHDTVATNVSSVLLADPGGFFAEEAEYSAGSNRLELMPRGMVNPLDLVRIQE